MDLRAKLTLRNDHLLRWRERRGLSQESTAELAGIAIPYLQAVERLDFSAPRFIEAACKLSAATGLPLDKIMPEELVSKALPTTYVQVCKLDPSRMLGHRDLLRIADAQSQAAEDLVDLKDSIAQALGHLSKRERFVVERRFGLGKDGEVWTLAKIGRSLNIGTEMVRQIESRALRRLHHPRITSLTRDFEERTP